MDAFPRPEPDPPAVRIAFRADDAGISAESNRAIADACLNGVCRNVSVMAVGKELDDAAERLRPLRGIDVGLHAALTCEWSRPRFGPVLGAERVPDLRAEDGAFPQRADVLHRRGAGLDQMLMELAGQLRALRGSGLEPVYVDFHMGVDWLPGLDEAAEQWAQREGLSYQPHRGLHRLIKGPPTGDRVAAVAEAISTHKEGDYLLVAHPGYPMGDLLSFRLGDDPSHDVAADRDAQRRLLMDPVVLEAMRQSRASSVRLTELQSVRPRDAGRRVASSGRCRITRCLNLPTSSGS